VNNTLLHEIKTAWRLLPLVPNQYVVDPSLAPPSGWTKEIAVRVWVFAGGSAADSEEEIKASLALEYHHLYLRKCIPRLA
jgi:hypothetical protein